MKINRLGILKIITSVCMSCVLLGFAIFLQLNLTAMATSGNEKRLLPIYNVGRDDNCISISFDAAWGADKTDDIISVLNDNDIKATFFLVSFWAEKYPDKVQNIVNAGMEIGTHSKNHPHFNKLDKNATYTELKDSIDTIKDVANVDVKLFRPPFGEYNNTLISTAEELSLSTIQWDVDSLDWKGISANEIANRLITKTHSGSIILCHNNADNIVEALKIALPTLKNKGFKFVPIGQLIYQDNYIINQNGTQILQ